MFEYLQVLIMVSEFESKVAANLVAMVRQQAICF